VPVILRRAAALLGGATLALAGVLPAAAHAVKDLGSYTVAIGFDNTVEVIVSDKDGKPVNDLQPGALKVQISAGDTKSDTMDLAPGFDPDSGEGTPGDYNTPLIPTAPGAYTFHVTGDIHGTKVDQTITASDQTFAVVTEPSEAQFPAKVPSTSAMSQQLQRDAARLAVAQQKADDASSAATRATIIGIVALVVGVVLGGAGLLLARRRRT
jgi:hypothetical protein